MSKPVIFEGGGVTEVNLRVLFEKLYKKKWLFLFSLFVCLALGFLYIKLATPIYQVSASLLIDPSGKSRKLGESKYVEGGVGLIETEKNLNNEIGVIQSYDLIRKALDESDFLVSYHKDHWYKSEEQHGGFPFKVEFSDSVTNLYDVPFYVEIMSGGKYRLYIKEKEFTIANPGKHFKSEAKEELNFNRVYRFGEPVKHKYFQFVLKQAMGKASEAFEGEDLFFVLHDLEGLTADYMGKLKVEQSDLQASIVHLETQGSVVQKEIKFLQKLLEKYLELKLEERDKIAVSKEEFIRSQLASVADSLNQAERNLEIFKRGVQTLDLNLKATVAADQIQKMQNEQAQIDLSIKYYDSQLKYLTDTTDIDKLFAPSMVGINDPLLNENLLDLKRLYSERTRTEYSKGSKNFESDILNQQIATTKKSLTENLINLKRSSEMALNDVNVRMDRAQGIINVLPSNEKQMLTYQRQVILYQDLFNYLSQELAKTGIAKAENIQDTKVLDEPRMDGDGPIHPNGKLILAFAFIIGLVIPTTWVGITESLDNTIQSLTDLEAASDISVIASIAQKAKINEENPSASNLLHLWRLEESFRDLSAKLQFLVTDKKKNVIGVSSTVAGEGKSFCAYNLAISLASGGKKVLLIDSDLRKPGVIMQNSSNGKKKASKKGIAEYLGNVRLSVKSVIHVDKQHPNFHYIPNFTEQDNPHKLLGGTRMETLISVLREEYDFILVDSPALGLVSDYLLISNLIDIHLFVLRRGVSKYSYLKDLNSLRKRGHFETVYLVFNGVPGKDFKYGMSYYGYNYGAKKKEKA